MNWFPVGKNGANKTYSDKEQCESEEGQACYEITGKDLRYHTLQEIEVGQDENQQPILETQLLEDAGLKASVEAADLAQVGSEAAIALKLKNMEFGKRVLAIVSIRNDAKSLQPADVVSLSNTYAPIQGLLLNGSIATAKAQVEAITPDGTLVTQGDLDAILAEMNAYLGV